MGFYLIRLTTLKQEVSTALKFVLSIISGAKRAVIFFDLDNTLANTWPTLIKNHSIAIDKNIENETARLLALEPRMGTIALFNRLEESNITRVVLTARPVSSFDATVQWLKTYVDPRIGASDNISVNLVSTPYLKMLYWIPLKIYGKKIFVIDDLTYNHENGTVKEYNILIKSLNFFKIPSIGFKSIQKLNNSSHRDEVKLLHEEIKRCILSK